MRESRRAGRGDACADRRRARSDRLVEGEYDGVRRAYAGLDGRSGWIGREREVECARGPVHLTRCNTGDGRRGLRLHQWDDRDAGRDRQNGSRENSPGQLMHFFPFEAFRGGARVTPMTARVVNCGEPGAFPRNFDVAGSNRA
jgi:hypothetical protein